MSAEERSDSTVRLLDLRKSRSTKSLRVACRERGEKGILDGVEKSHTHDLGGFLSELTFCWYEHIARIALSLTVWILLHTSYGLSTIL
jgi:hypothetical protein